MRCSVFVLAINVKKLQVSAVANEVSMNLNNSAFLASGVHNLVTNFSGKFAKF